LIWPYDAANAQAVLENALGLIEQAPYLTAGKGATFEQELTADIARYVTSGTPNYLTAQFAKVQDWARGNHVSPQQILVGEYGVAQPSHTTFGEPLPTSPAWFSDLLTTVDRMGFAAEGWDLDSGFGITCGKPGSALSVMRMRVCFPENRSAPPIGYGLPHPPIGPRQSGKGSSKIAGTPAPL
jgi:hypothetical protein